MKSLPLSTNWQVKQRGAAQSLADDFAASDGWIPASAPGTVHQDLLAAGLIPDPFVGLNELDRRFVRRTGAARRHYSGTASQESIDSGAPNAARAAAHKDALAAEFTRRRCSHACHSDAPFLEPDGVIGKTQ